MIHCTLEQFSGMLKAFESTGHGVIDNKDAQVSIACASVSTLIRTMGILLERHNDIVVQLERFEPGSVKLNVVGVGEQTEDWLRGITDMLAQGLRDIEQDFPSQVEFRRILK